MHHATFVAPALLALLASLALSSPLRVQDSAPEASTQSIGAEFKAKGKYWGVAADIGTLRTQSAEIIKQNFGQVTAENSMKWDATEPAPGQFTFANADALVDFAIKHHLLIRGHTLIWYSQLPQWVQNIRDKRELTLVIQNHIRHLVGRWKGKIFAWDVCNEILNEDGSMRPSVFYNVLGEDFVRIAFEAAAKADPRAQLYINDYNIDDPNYPKTKAMIERVKRWQAQGIPITGIGCQAHLSNGAGPRTAAALKELATAVPNVAVTELDIKNAQPSDYIAVEKGCLALRRCRGITSWGTTDAQSWRPGDNALLFDSNFKPKQAYVAMLKVASVRS